MGNKIEEKNDIVDSLEEMLGMGEDAASSENTGDENIEGKQEEEKQVQEDTSSLKESAAAQTALTKEIAKIDVKIEELQSASVDMEAFYANIEEHLSEEEQELEFSNKPAYMKLIAQRAREFEENNQKKDEIAALEEQKKELEQTYARREAINSITSKFPDFNYENVESFFHNELSKKEQQAIYEAASSYEDVYERAYKKYLEKNPSKIAKQSVPNIPNVNLVRKQNVSHSNINDDFTSDDDKLKSALGF